MKKMFKDIMDTDGAIQRCPIAKDAIVFFTTEDNKYYVYALYTKRDLSGSKLIQLTSDSYDDEIADYKIRYGVDPAIIDLPSTEAIIGVTEFVKYKAAVDNTSLEDLYNLNYKGE